MRSPSASLLLLLLVASLSPVHGVLEANYTNLKCNCLRMSTIIPVRHITRLQVLPAGNGCPEVEIIAWMKNKSIVCLNPRASWLQKLFNMLLKETGSSTLRPIKIERTIP
ncbi:C-X-C motif chemokine 13 [Choloepus didactylus]|uniref:C-X-C motif chemokine 13 n=1 Tax=Choloepus didactylus TaxID=27675 RepID=UPI00189E0DB3|nr:C-X-C motif chemokine 13 [Choloepus didactylus]